ncbi:Sialic acid TRAP transporter permease protein SiaT [Roseovarius albus]|uniref:TRAP transporter large permease protein n=1 Tax=Roseovarius albus TaxID=1247867 RepID=A0A1X7A9S2_9RHOB|nr:TRAP transporter large permease subunit [Roseovarius albus]SLN73793.1 Sialic acid TRAP transporter permease protein SiaT [Roseovarius albus]
MDPLTFAILAAGCLFLFLALGIPVGVAMGLVGIGGMLVDLGPNFAFGQLQTLPFAVVNDYSLAVLPMFVLMGVLAEASGVTAEVFRVADLWLRRMKGGLYQAVIVGSAIFAAISGSTAVNAVVFTRIAFPEMIKYGYSRSLSLGAIAGAGSFAAMIPPSITMVIYAVMTEQSVGQLLMAGIIPGLVTAVVYLSGVRVLVSIRPSLAPPITEAVPMREKVRALRGIWPIPVLLLLVLGGIYTGTFPPSAAGAVGAFGAFLYAFARKQGFKGWLVPALQDAAFISCILFIVLIGGLLLSRMLVVVGVIDDIVLLVTSIADTPIKFLLLVSIIYIVLGCFLDTTSMMVVTLPFFFPVTQELGIDPIWFGIVVTKLIEISVVTPPVGLNLFAVMGGVKGQATFADIYKGVIPFIFFDLIVLALLIVLPGLATWLPQAMIQ